MIVQQHRPQVGRTCDDCDEPEGAPKPTGVLQEEEVPPSRLANQEDTGNQAENDQGE